MTATKYLPTVVVIALSIAKAFAGLTPNDVVVVYNSNAAWITVSKAVADYYCTSRGIPDSNKLGVDCPVPAVIIDPQTGQTVPRETLDPIEFRNWIMTPIRDHLITHFGADPDDPSSCRIKCIVLCYGIPVRMTTATRYCSVDSALSALYEESPWGRTAMKTGADSSGEPNVSSAYCDTGGPDYLSARGSKPIDFSEFRASASNETVQSPPNFKIIRFIDGSHAVAGGEQGMLWRGVMTDGSWAWTATPDEDKGFVTHTISEICASPSKLWACTGGAYLGFGGSVLATADGGTTWQTMRSARTDNSGERLHGPLPYDGLYQLSFYDDYNGWAVGKEAVFENKKYIGDFGFIIKTANGGISWQKVTPPSGLSSSVSCVAAPDAEHIWVGGYGGIYISYDGGASWIQQTNQGISKLWVRKVGTDYVGWAIGYGGLILHLAEGSWHTDSCPAGYVNLTDLAVYDISHAAIAYGQGSFLKWKPSDDDPCGGHWEIDSSDANYPKDSVAIDGEGNCLAASGKTIRVGRNNGGALSWSESYSIPNARWRMRFLVCRLDGMADLIDQETGIPKDIRDMIDRSVASDGGGSGRFILDYGSRAFHAEKYPWAEQNLIPLVGSQNIKVDYGQTYYTNESGVMGYFSEGRIGESYLSDLLTTFGRPFNQFNPGAIGMYGDGFEAVVVRRPKFTHSPDRDGPGPSNGILRFVLLGVGNSSTSPYNSFALKLYSAQTKQLLATQVFGPHPDPQRPDIAADITLNASCWSEGAPLAQIEFPNAPPEVKMNGTVCGFPGRVLWDSVVSLNSADLNDGGTYEINVDHARCTELIREGASGTMGTAHEPFGGANTDQMNGHYYSFPRYVQGLTWAEASHLGIGELGGHEVVIGDPLMAPYAKGKPVVSFQQPSEGATLSGHPTITVNAQPAVNATGIVRVEFWLSKLGTDGHYSHYKRIGVDTQAPFTCTFDSTTFPDGDCTLRAVAYEDNPQREAWEATRQVVIANTAGPTDLEIIQPSETEISDSVTVTAAASNPSVITRIDFWILTSSGLQLISSGTSFSCNLDTTVHPDGACTIYAQAYWTDGGDSGEIWSRQDVTISNPGVVSITSPETDGKLVSGLIDVNISVSTSGPPSVSKVELWLSGNGITDTLIGSDTTGPEYSVAFDTTTFSDGTYTLKAVAYKSPDDKRIINDASRSVEIINTYTHCLRITGARALPDGTRIALEAKPVIAGTSVTMEGALYIAESDRSAGVRVAWAQGVVPVGKLVSLFGTVGNAITGERQITAEKVWIVEDAPTIQAMRMNNYEVGGMAPVNEPYTNGVTGSLSLYNIGLLVRVTGRVTYVGSDFVYIDDGSNVTDGNNLQGAIRVPLDGSAIPVSHPTVVGIRVYFGNLNKPSVGDYIAVTGISSVETIGTNIVPQIRVRSQADVSCYQSYQRCAKTTYGYFVTPPPSLTQLEVGAKARMIDACVWENNGSSFGVLHTEDWIYPIWIYTKIMATTQLEYGQWVTITGEVNEDESGTSIIVPDAIYLGGSDYGALSVSKEPENNTNDGKTGGGVYTRWPYPNAEAIIASLWFQERYYQEGAIGWALSQPDGTLIDLLGEQVTDEWYDGRVFGLKESFEPDVGAPKLLLCLDNPVKRLGNRMYSIDIVGGTLTTLSDGQRAIVKPEAVYVYTDQRGRYMFAVPWLKWLRPNSSFGEPFDSWPWKVQIAP